MSLKGYKPPTRSVHVPGNDALVVRGLSLFDIAEISRRYRDEIEPVFAKLKGASGEAAVRDFDVKMLGAFMIETAPAIAGLAVALAADEPECADVVQRLPVPVQVELIHAVGELTFQGEGGAKKVLQTVTKMLAGARGLAIGNPAP